MKELIEPTFQDILAARLNVYRFLKPTPLYQYSGLSELVGTQVWVKHENHLPVGAFKVRGGINFVAGMTEQERRAGLFTASTGNHGQSIAYAAQQYGVKATIAVPEQANPHKVAAMRGLGAKVVFYGADFDEARQWIAEQSSRESGYFVGPTDPSLICGVGTYAVEIVEALPDVETIIVPVGAGSGACGVCIVAKSINPKIQVIAAQSAQAPANQLSWATGKHVTAPTNTFAEGVATRVPFENTQCILRRYLDDFVLVDDQEIKTAIRLLLEHTHNLAEGAGAVSLAAALKLKDRLAQRKTVIVLSGGNLLLDSLKKILVP